MLLDIMYRLRHESDRICIQVTSVALIQPARKLLLFVSHQSGTIYTIQPIRHFSRCVVLSALQGSSAVTVAPWDTRLWHSEPSTAPHCSECSTWQTLRCGRCVVIYNEYKPQTDSVI